MKNGTVINALDRTCTCIVLITLSDFLIPIIMLLFMQHCSHDNKLHDT